MASNVITNIESKNKATKHLNFGNVIFIVAYLVLAYMFRDIVSELLFIPYMIFSSLCAIYLTIPSRFNKGRTHAESIVVLLRKDNTVYRPFTGGGEDNGLSAS